VAEHLLLDLDPCLAASPTLTATDHYPQVWHAGQVHARSFGIPIQPTVDFLWYRKDLFDRLGLEPPRTFADVLDCARVLHHPARNQAGIVWNAAPGVAIVETFLQILGAQTGSPADLGEGDPVRSSGTSSTVAGRGPGEPGRDHPGCQFEPAGPVR